MRQATGKTYGFGRVSANIRPSPYSPVHLASVAPGISPPYEAASALAPPRRRRHRRRLAAVLTAAALVAASALAVVGWLRAAPSTAARGSDPDTPQRASPVAAGDGAGRVASAAVQASSRTAHP